MGFNSGFKGLIKVCLVGTRSFQEDRQRDMTKLIVAFCDFANVPRNCIMWSSV